jgi:hypothetical protein
MEVTRTSMIEHRVRLMVVPWQDRAFVRELDAICADLTADHVELDSTTAADRAQRVLREGGYPRAVVEYHRTVDDVLHARADWVVRRDGRPRDVPG